MPVVKSLFNYHEVEELICGQSELNFEELRDHSNYGGGFGPTDPTVKWFWEIILDEMDDDKRRKLLTFATGSDRAPVNGLKSLSPTFAIIKDG